MSNAGWILFWFLMLANGTWAVSEVIRRKSKKKEIKELRKKKEAEMIHRSGADSLETLNDDDLEDEIEPKQRHIWIMGVVICLDIWIVGAVFTHWWATTYFTDDETVTTEVACQKAADYGIAAGATEESDATTRGLFGDSFGAVNALVSAFAFAGMIVAFVLQRYELRLQRKELRDNRKEMKQQTAQFAAENKNLEIQRFENLFYNMLNLQQEIVNGLRYEYYEEEYVTVALDGGGAQTDTRKVKREVVGRNVFRYLFREVPLTYEAEGENKTIHGYIQYLRREGMGKYDGTQLPSNFDHYFRHLYKIVQYVDSQPFSFEEKYRYLSFMRGTLSRYELVWLYYNALYPDFIRFKKLIERYSLLKALRSDLLSISRETIDYYNGLGVTDEDLKAAKIGIDDFAFFLTNNENEEGKYMVSAFWNNEDSPEGEKFLADWRAFINDKATHIINDTTS